MVSSPVRRETTRPAFSTGDTRIGSPRKWDRTSTPCQLCDPWGPNEVHFDRDDFSPLNRYVHLFMEGEYLTAVTVPDYRDIQCRQRNHAGLIVLYLRGQQNHPGAGTIDRLDPNEFSKRLAQFEPVEKQAHGGRFAAGDDQSIADGQICRKTNFLQPGSHQPNMPGMASIVSLECQHADSEFLITGHALIKQSLCGWVLFYFLVPKTFRLYGPVACFDLHDLPDLEEEVNRMTQLFDGKIKQRTLIAAQPERVFDTITSAKEWDAFFTTGMKLDLQPGGICEFAWKDWGPDETP